MTVSRSRLLDRYRAAVIAGGMAVAMLLVAAQGASAGGAHHLLEALEPPREVVPRAVTMTENFELVVLVDRGRLMVFLDNAVNNAAVTGATVDLDVADKQFNLEETAPGVYTTTSWLPAPGISSMMFSVIAGDVDDLLIVDFKLDGAVAAQVQAPGASAGTSVWSMVAGDTGRVVTVLLVAGAILIALGVIFAGALPASLTRWTGVALPVSLRRGRRD